LRRFASRPGGPSRTTPTPRCPARPADRPAAATSSACGPPVGRCTPARPGGLLLTVELAAVLALGRLAVQGGVQPGGGVVLAHPGNGGGVDLQHAGDHLVGPAGASLALIGFEQDTGIGQGTGRDRRLGRSGCEAARVRVRTGQRSSACACSAPQRRHLLTARSMRPNHTSATTTDEVLTRACSGCQFR
jgi:hypothetical protein